MLPPSAWVMRTGVPSSSIDAGAVRDLERVDVARGDDVTMHGDLSGVPALSGTDSIENDASTARQSHAAAAASRGSAAQRAQRGLEIGRGQPLEHAVAEQVAVQHLVEQRAG